MNVYGSMDDPASARPHDPTTPAAGPGPAVPPQGPQVGGMPRPAAATGANPGAGEAGSGAYDLPDDVAAANAAAASAGATGAATIPPMPSWSQTAPSFDLATPATPATHPEVGSRRGLRRRDARRTAPSGGGGGGSKWRKPLIGLAIGGAILAGTSVFSSMSNGDGGVSLGGSGSTYGYYHDKEFAQGTYSSRWGSGNGSLLGSSRQSDYDGAYRYGGYGSAGMKERVLNPGEARTDPLYDTPTDAFSAGPDVFDAAALSARVDPTGGQPVGDGSLLSAYDTSYSPYAGYSNPYLNRLRMAYGPGYGTGAVSEGESAAVGAGRAPGMPADALLGQ